MRERSAQKKVITYFQRNNIEYSFYNNGRTSLYFLTNSSKVIGRIVVTCVTFYQEYLYLQSSFSLPATMTEGEEARAARFVNFLNTNLFYDCNTLFEHIFTYDEDHRTFQNSCLVRYELLEIFSTKRYGIS